jgi:hypothetical protein
VAAELTTYNVGSYPLFYLRFFLLTDSVFIFGS